MARIKPRRHGPKTLEQLKRMLERKPSLPRRTGSGDVVSDGEAAATPQRLARKARRSEFPVSRRGMNQESKHRKRKPLSPDPN